MQTREKKTPGLESVKKMLNCVEEDQMNDNEDSRNTKKKNEKDVNNKENYYDELENNDSFIRDAREQDFLLKNDKEMKHDCKKKQILNLNKWYRLFIYDLILWFLSIIFDLFFREIRPRGAFRIPKKGAVIFVAAPHANQFIDPIILMKQVKKEAQRRISFLIAAKSYKSRIIGFISKCQLSIPVIRSQDNLKNCTGKIFLDFEMNPLLLKGEGTVFTEECCKDGLIYLPQFYGHSEIDEVISDTVLILKKKFTDFSKIKNLLSEGTTFRTAKKVDQKDVYKLVFDHLSNDNCIGIFPEGGSHDRMNLLPLKAGVSIMALGAQANNYNCNIKIVPCGMNYFNAHKFRSRAVVEFGKPIELSKELIKKYKDRKTTKQAIKDLLEIITAGLKSVTVTCDDYETLLVVQAARRLYAYNFAQKLPLQSIIEMNRRLVLGYQTFKNEVVVQDLKKKILKYNEKLHQLYLPDHDVENCDESNKLSVIPVLIYRIYKLLFLFTLALPGLVLFLPVFLFAKIISKKKAKQALAKSLVKIKANDVVATWKILIGMGFAPILYSFYATLGTWYVHVTKITQVNLLMIWILLYLLGVLVTYSALITGEQGLDLLKSILPLYLSITSDVEIKELKKLRSNLADEITEVVDKYGKILFPNDFNILNLKNKNDSKTTFENLKIDQENDQKNDLNPYDNQLKKRKKTTHKSAYT